MTKMIKTPKRCNYTKDYGCHWKWEGECLLIHKQCPRGKLKS